MNNNFFWDAPNMAILVNFQTSGHDSLHFSVTQKWIVVFILAKLLRIIGDKLKSSAIWIKYLATAGCIFCLCFWCCFHGITDADIGFILPESFQLPWNTARFSI